MGDTHNIAELQFVRGPGLVSHEAKLSLQMNNRELAPILEASKQFDANDDDTVLGKARRFPFPLIRVDIAGRDDRVGLNVTVVLEKENRQK